jgi:lipid-A-disaccharide synthase
MRIGMVAGEPSGDYLGAGLLRTLKSIVPRLEVEGIAGPKMIEEGAKSLFPMDEISVIGVDGLLKNLPRLLKIRHELYQQFISNPPDVFVGIDLPDFNLHLEEKLRARGILTIHYVSPTVWAWRGWRINRIKRAVDHMLVLFPFEEAYYRKHGVGVTFVGHPVADELPDDNIIGLRTALGLPIETEIVALLPGSRINEVTRLGDDFLEAAQILHDLRPGIEFSVPYVSKEIRAIFNRQKSKISNDVTFHEFEGQSVHVMAAADAILVASGTAALEATMLRKPMVVAYRVSGFSYVLAKLLMRTPYISMPNNLVGAFLVPEVLQQDVTGLRLSNELISILDDPERSAYMIKNLDIVYKQLKNNANKIAAERILNLSTSLVRA